MEICLQLLVAVQSKLQAEMPDLMILPVINVNSDADAQISLMVGRRGAPAFGEVSISCSIPEEDFSRRFVEARVCSTAWTERELSTTEPQDVAPLLM